MRAVLWMGGVVAALAVVIGTSRLGAQSKEKKPAAPRTRIALVNLTYVISNYSKYQQFKEESKKIVEPFEKRGAELRAKLKEMRDEFENPSLVPAAGENGGAKTRKELDEKAKKIQGEIEDNNTKAKLKVGKRLEEEAKIIYQDVEDAVRDYAVAHELDMVLHFNDAITKEDYFSGQNISRKLNTGALMPLYLADGLDISKEIADILNRNMRKD